MLHTRRCGAKIKLTVKCVHMPGTGGSDECKLYLEKSAVQYTDLTVYSFNDKMLWTMNNIIISCIDVASVLIRFIVNSTEATEGALPQSIL